MNEATKEEGEKITLPRKEQEEKEEEEGTNEKLQRILKEKQNEQYLKMMEKHENRSMEQSNYWSEMPVLAPDLELLKLRMDEAELISGLSGGIYSELVNIPDNLPERENLDLKSVSGYAVQVDSFVLTNPLFKRKMVKT